MASRVTARMRVFPRDKAVGWKGPYGVVRPILVPWLRFVLILVHLLSNASKVGRQPDTEHILESLFFHLVARLNAYILVEAVASAWRAVPGESSIAVVTIIWKC